MQLERKHRDYWRRNLKMTTLLLLIWFFVSFVTTFFAREISEIPFFGFPLAFYLGAQGAPLLYLAIIGSYARYMNRLDREYGVSDSDNDSEE